MKKNGFFKQAGVLISRYLKIFFNDKQNLILTIAIPVLTIIVVTLVASGDMFCNSVDNYENEGYPLLSWELVEYEASVEDEDEDSEEKDDKDSEDEDEDDKDSDDNKDDKDSDDDDDDENFKVWDGVIPQQPQLVPLDEEGEEYYVNSPGDLQFIAYAKGEWLEKTYYLNCNIDMDGNTIMPIGTKNDPFKGKFEGNGHIIRNFVLETGEDYVGLFGKVKGKDAEIRNIGIEDADIKDEGKSKAVGFVAGCLESGIIESCYSKDSTIDTKSDNVGGIVGVVEGKEETVVRNCYSRAEITVDGKNVGGIAGLVSEGSIKYTYFAGSLVAEGKEKNSESFGAVAGFIENEESFKNTIKCVYDKDIIKDFSAVGNKEDGKRYLEDNDIVGWETDHLKENSSLIRSLEKNVEEDEVNGNFKNDGELANFSGTQTGLFMLVCVAIFVGICNSVQEICKERNILKREYMTNLRLSSYIISKLVVQGMVCAVQMLVVMLIFFLSVKGKAYPSSGVLIGSAMIEMYITMFLVTFAADAIALLISSIVKNSSTANTFIPIVLIVQIVFSGVLFDLGDAMEAVAAIMISKWGIGALAATCHLNEARMSMMLENPEMALQMGDEMTRIKDLFVSTPGNLVMIWGVLLAFVFVCSIMSGILLTRVKKDKR